MVEIATLIKKAGSHQIAHQSISILLYRVARRILGKNRLTNKLKTVGSVQAVAVSIGFALFQVRSMRHGAVYSPKNALLSASELGLDLPLALCSRLSFCSSCGKHRLSSMEILPISQNRVCLHLSVPWHASHIPPTWTPNACSLRPFDHLCSQQGEGSAWSHPKDCWP